MGGIVPIQGVFYCTGSKKYSPFNCFREENPLNLPVAPYNRDYPYSDIDSVEEKRYFVILTIRLFTQVRSIKQT